ncbi:MAG: DUF4430 domain-containing protein [Candidatus Nezhaarchaeota archaeon]|nr:DUF4430 domain-containing protein [Candidatus Nezhaarchaeota archaeon]
MAKWRSIAVLALCWAVVASLLAAHYYVLSLTQPARPAMLGSVLLIIDYGNGTFHLYNATLSEPVTLFNLTARVAAVEYEEYPGLGIFVTSINHVANNPAESKYWTWWYWDGRQWALGPVGAGAFRITNSTVVCWYYSFVDPGTWTMRPPSSKIFSLEIAPKRP